jgi:hypothetical protein
MSAPEQQKMTEGAQSFASPLSIDIREMSIEDSHGNKYNYEVPNPEKIKMCCCIPMKGDDFQDGFFMDFAHGSDTIRFKECKKTGCQCDSNFVEIYRNGRKLGHLEKPFRCCDPCCLCLDECCSKDMLLMSFRHDHGDGDTEKFTMRKKGAGCCFCCRGDGDDSSGCCACFGKCCGTVDMPTVLNETFQIYGPFEDKDQSPKGRLTIIYRRGQMYGKFWTPMQAQIDAPDVTEDDHMLLLLGFAYGLLYQSKMHPGTFPRFVGELEQIFSGQGTFPDKE